ncbi:MAG: PhoH family protein [Ignavibacteriaceae bacterium]
MTAVEKKFTLENTDMLSLLGMNDSNLRLIEDKFNASIVVRGENFVVKGVLEEVEVVEKIIKEMVYVLNTSGTLRPTDVEAILDLTLHGKEIISEKEIDSVVLYTKNDAIKAKTPGQLNYLQTAMKNDICFAIGPAGTGKTYLAVALAVSALKKGNINKIVLARPAVEAGESLGFLPGDFREKIDPYLRPLYDALDDMMPSEKLKGYLEKGIVEIVPLAYMRGRTLNNAFVILDEAQNATATQMKMFLTRLGVNSKAIITGDITQIDLPPKSVSGLIEAKDILKNIEGVGFVYFDKSDVVRHKLVKDIINAYEKFKNGDNKESSKAE